MLGDVGADFVDVEAHVYAIGYGLLVVVLHYEVLVEEAEGLLGGRGSEADQEGVEIFEDLAPEVVDRAVALVDDYKIEVFDGDAGIVGDGQRVFVEIGEIGEGFFFGVGVYVRLALEDGVKALNGSDADFGGGIEL